MAEILLEGRDCEACGTEVRKGALFCYHCGESVAPDVVVTTDTKKVSDARVREDVTAVAAKEEKIIDDAETSEDEIIEDEPEVAEEAEETEIVEDKIVEDDAETEKDEAEIVEDELETNEDESVIVEDKTEIENKTEIADEETETEKDTIAETEDKPKLKSAAAMRRRPKRIQKKRVEMVWEEPNNPPNVWFLVATILFALLAVGLWFAAKYLG